MSTVSHHVGQGSRTWRAYMSVERDPTNNNQPTNARDRIGAGPWYNASLVLVANNLAELHSRTGDAAVFVDERGQRINGQWTGSPSPVQHDMLTGSNADGTLLPGSTCSDWTSDSAAIAAQVGHSDGMGPNQRYRRLAILVELGACQPELRRHGAAWRCGPVLLLRPVEGSQDPPKRKPRELSMKKRRPLRRAYRWVRGAHAPRPATIDSQGLTRGDASEESAAAQVPTNTASANSDTNQHVAECVPAHLVDFPDLRERDGFTTAILPLQDRDGDGVRASHPPAARWHGAVRRARS